MIQAHELRITESEYLNALEVIKKYRIQINN
jgi:hypothetical protein